MLFPTTNEALYKAARVVLRLNQWTGSAELTVDPDIPNGYVAVIIRRPFFISSGLVCTSDSELLTVRAVEPTRSRISASNTGDITSTGGYANSGIDYGGETQEHEPHFVPFSGSETVLSPQFE